jgi:hypothetical protein
MRIFFRRGKILFYIPLVSVFFLSPLLCRSEEDTVKNVWLYQVQRVSHPPVIDGKQDDKAWDEIPPLTNFGKDRYDSGKHPMLNISVQMGWDSVYLYCLFKIYNPGGEFRINLAELEKKQRERMYDTPMWWNYPSQEVRIDGRRDRAGETMIQMNMVGQKEAMQKIATGWSTEYSEGWEVWGDYKYVAGYDEQAWWTELRVALEDLGAEPVANYVMGAQFRYFHPGGFFAWTPGGYDVGLYGDLLLVEKPLSFEDAMNIAHPGYKEQVVNIPWPDKIVVIDHGRFYENTYREMLTSLFNDLKKGKDALMEELKMCSGIDQKSTTEYINKEFALVEEEFKKTVEFTAADMIRMKQPMEAFQFALSEVKARVNIYHLVKGKDTEGK